MVSDAGGCQKVVWPPDGRTLPRRALLAAMEADAAAAKRMSRTETRENPPGRAASQPGDPNPTRTPREAMGGGLALGRYAVTDWGPAPGDLEAAERELAARVEDRASPDADPDQAALLEAIRIGEDRQALRIVRRIRAASVPALEPLGRQLERSRSRSPARLRTSLRRCSPGSAG